MTDFSPKNLCIPIFYCFLLFFIQVAEVEATGTLELMMNYFQNPSEHLDDGSCCDTLCFGQCDDIFQFSLDQSSGNVGNAKTYYYWEKKTTTYQDQNNVYFQDNMNGVNNPILWNFDSWPGSVLFKVYIEDDDYPYSSNDYLDGMVQSLTLTPAKTKSQAKSTTITVYGLRSRDKTILSLSYKLYCDDNYYGPSCSVNCLPQDSESTGHYTCDQDTGKKLCRTGWEDDLNNCRTFSDDCLGVDCHNGLCVDGINSYSCSCTEGFTGGSCETNVDECASNPCQHASTCSDLVDGYICACAPSYVGPQCQYTTCSQTSTSVCSNGGTCYGNLQCLCKPGYIGNGCELKTCDAVPCVNAGICSSNSTCLCSPEYTGNQCEVLKCDLISDHCKNGGSCVEGNCVCQKPYNGISCEMEGCTNSTCQNGGTCVPTDGGIGYKCMCTQLYSGQNCQSLENICTSPTNQQAVKSGDADVSIFTGDAGILVIVLIVFCVIFFIIIIVLIVVMCYRRRKKRVYDKHRLDSTNSTNTILSTVNDSVISSSHHRIENSYSNGSLDDVFCGGDSIEKPGKKDFDEEDHNNAENHYEKMDGMLEQSEMTAAGQRTSEQPERFDCKINDIREQSIRLEDKLAK